MLMKFLCLVSLCAAASCADNNTEEETGMPEFERDNAEHNDDASAESDVELSQTGEGDVTTASDEDEQTQEDDSEPSPEY